MTDEPGWYYPTCLNEVSDTVHFPGYLQAFQTYLETRAGALGISYSELGGASWGSLHPIGESAGNPLSGGPASIQNRRLYYWSARFYTESAVDGMKLGQQAVTTAVGHAVATGVNWANGIDRWYVAAPGASIGNNPIVNADSAMGGMDWMYAGRASAHTAWTEDWFGDTNANAWSILAAVMRSATQAGTQSFGAYVVGQTMGQFSAGGKYKILPLFGNGARNYCGYTFGPIFQATDGWSENAAALTNPLRLTLGNAYSEYADANRLIGRSETILHAAQAERSKIAILLPGASTLWDTQKAVPYYARELDGIYYAVSHGYNIGVDFVDDVDIGNGTLVARDYYVLYVVGPNVSERAQAQIENWIRTWGAHNRQIVLVQGAGVADEYNTPTTVFDALAGLVAGSRIACRAPAASSPTADPYTATIRVTNAAFYFNGQTLNIRGPMQALSPLTAAAGPGITDQTYTSGALAGRAACTSMQYKGNGVSNWVTAFGFFAGYQYYASPNYSYTNVLPQAWSALAREIVMMPAIRQNPPRTVHVYGGTGPAGETLDEANEYLSTCPVEALRLNVGSGSPGAVAVVLLNWGGTPFDNLKFTVISGVANPTRFVLASGAALANISNAGGANEATMTLNDVDVVLISR